MQQESAALAGKVALVTGASRGIGRAIALRLGAAGATVVGTATSQSGADAISAVLAEHGVQGTGLCLDVTDAASVDAVMKTVTEQFGAPLVLVNNAGITKDNILMRMKDDEWGSVIDTNLTSIYRMSKACMRAMTKARFGRIINISSVVGSMGNAGQSNYAAAKAGLEGFTRSLARELGSRNITVNAVAPGFIDTDMTSGLPEEHRQNLLNQVPLGRLGQPEEIAGVVAFLAGAEGGYITGETLQVNGGMYMG
ncbi:3-oxoacyl-ACP reductase FabG [Parendozoicomonas haliclonae]|uniref:3-oxoacyl-[acyl-carrier-protein] reductase n=1 Tax=Parendozoicomonas haliclonae TaxID=1960125 RepID=A0A1X7AMI8_9GAMM|nr:3-oxoacyl-ACP reductase FabG [Parendozoicomonas haliclonae]SMA49161.1 3-oxoacyl-[acyl-carrier-protein] reductase FabG [Parendozoicomonas haliclonae]